MSDTESNSSGDGSQNSDTRSHPSTAEENQREAQPVKCSTRPPVTTHERDALRTIADSLKNLETFYLKGSIPDVTTQTPFMTYAVAPPGGDDDSGSMVPRLVPLRNAEEAVLDALHADCTPSHFGQGKETVMDESYRLARELRADKLSFNVDFLAPRYGIVGAISAYVKTGVEVEMYKLNSYGLGGHFKAHQDTPKSKQHLGTLLIGLPAPYSGGELILRHADQSVTIDWSSTGRKDATSFPWVFFYSDVEHEILPVKSGHRLTLAFDVFSSRKVRYALPIAEQPVDVTCSNLYTQLKGYLLDETFLPQGAKLVFGLSHEYPAAEMEVAKKTSGFDTILKGRDVLLWQALTKLGLKMVAKAAYEPEEWEYCADYYEGEDPEGSDYENRFETDEFSCYGMHPGQRWETVIHTAKSFKGIDPDYMVGEETSKEEALRDSVGAEVEWDAIWVTKPSKFTKASTYGTYGNEPSTDSIYVSGALFVTLPAIGAGCRGPEGEA